MSPFLSETPLRPCKLYTASRRLEHRLMALRNLILDTGSYDMWVAGAGCTTCGNSKLFEPSKSTTYSDKPGTAFKIGYGTGVDTDPLPGDAQYVPGKWVTDDVGIANFTAKGQQFVLVSSYPPFLDDVPFDGVMGVGRPGYTQTPNQTPWYWSLYDDNNGTHSKISFFYPPGKVDGAEVTIGGVNPRRYTGAINWQILSNRFSSLYTLDQTGVAINGQSFRAKSRDLAILDTGTPFISVNNKTVSALYAQISPKITEIDRGVWGGPCDVVDAVAPTIALTYAGARTPLDLTIPKSAFNLGPYKGSNTTCQTLFLGLDLFGRPDDGYDTWLVGAPLLKQYYTVWDGAYGQIGFANPVFN